MNPRNRTKGRKDWPKGLIRRDRPSGTYYYWKDPRNGKEESLKCKGDFQTAKKKAAKLNAIIAQQLADEVVKNIAYRPDSQSRKFKDFVPLYLQYCKEAGQAFKTIKTKRSHLNAVLERFGNRRVNSLSVKDVKELLDHYVNQGKKWKAKHLRTYLIDLYRHARTTGDFDLDLNCPASATRAPKVKVKRSRWLLEQLLPVLDEAKKNKRRPWIYNSILLGLVTGQREDDLTNIRFRKLKDWDGMFKKWIESDHHEDERPYSFVDDEHLHMVQSKASALVKIPLNLRLDAIGLTVGDVVKMCRDRIASRYLLHHTTNTAKAQRGDKITYVTISANFKKCRDAVYPEDDWNGKTPPSFHELRSLSERLYKQQGINTQDLLGHKSPKSTEVYHDSRQAEWVEIKL